MSANSAVSVSGVPLLQRLKNYGQSGLRSPVRGVEVAKLLSDYRDLLELLPDTDTPAICAPLSTEQVILTHRRLRQFLLREFDLEALAGVPRGARVAVLLPNGAELAVALLGVLSGWCAAPINPTSTQEEIQYELNSTRAEALLLLAGAPINEAALAAVTALHAEHGTGRSVEVQVILLTPLANVAGLFRMNVLESCVSVVSGAGSSRRQRPTSEGSKFYQNVLKPTVGSSVVLRNSSNETSAAIATAASVPARPAPLPIEGYGSHPQTVLLLHTSGTSGNKKLVPYSLDMLVVGVGCIVSSWNLGPRDVCLNMMPLFHIGGIVRNVLSPLLSGGCVVTCTGFDAVLFWNVLVLHNDKNSNSNNYRNHSHNSSRNNSGGYQSLPQSDSSAVDGSVLARQRAPSLMEETSLPLPPVTWYYASPTMHQSILQQAAVLVNEQQPQAALQLPVEPVRFIANAAGALLPVLAAALKQTFSRAVILTSYGMTECMPISTPPQDYALNPTGTSGTPVGPDVLIVDMEEQERCSPGDAPPPLRAQPRDGASKGNIFIRGTPCFSGYENNGAANEESFFSVEGHGDGWFNTGDTGCMDSKGYLFISGRSKEIINRGGETISPFEIEEVVQQHPWVAQTLAFSAPHQQYQETAGIVIVTKTGCPQLDLPSLHRYLDGRLHRSKWPMVMVFSSNLPKNAAGKLLRIKYAERCGLPTLDDDDAERMAPSRRLFTAVCPPVGASLKEPIACVSLDIEPLLESKTRAALLSKTHMVAQCTVVQADLPFHPAAVVAFVTLRGLTGPTPRAATKDKSATVFSPMVAPVRVQEEQFVKELQEMCAKELDQYLVPLCIFSVDHTLHYSVQSAAWGSRTSTSQPQGSGAAELAAAKKQVQLARLRELAASKFKLLHTVGPRNATETKLELVWRSLLRPESGSGSGGANSGTNLSDSLALSVTSNFFDLGGDSLKAGQLINSVRRELGVQVSVADLFAAPTIEGMAQKIATMKILGSPAVHAYHSGGSADGGPSSSERRRRRLGSIAEDNDSLGGPADKFAGAYDFSAPLSSHSFGCLTIQLLPICLVYPVRRVMIWFLIAYPWVHLMKRGVGRFESLLIAMFLSRLALGVVCPLLGILMKWLIIGRYRAGKYPLWGAMYLKWWITEQIVNIMGKGFFRDDIPLVGPHLVRLYYVLMGARIGVNVKIHKDAMLGQADLIDIGDDVSLDKCTIRPFTLEEGHFVLLPIKLGDRCSVGVKSIVTPGSVLPSGACMGPLSSSYEAEADAEPYFKQYCRPTYMSPPKWMVLLLGIPIMVLGTALSFVPWFFVLKMMVEDAKTNGWYKTDMHSVYHAFLWWITPQRLFYFFLLRVIKRCVVPPMKLLYIILIKRLLVGKFSPMGPEEKSQPWNRFRYWLMSKLLPGGGLAGVAKLVGTHYELISVIYRLLGANIGQRVYWPGSGIEIVEFDLLTVGDDVVFGSRSVILTSTATHAKPVVFEAGAMVADRCVVLPGAVLRRSAVLGSGSLAAEDMELPLGSVWVGSKGGRAVCVAPGDASFKVKDTVTPFGRAFYQRLASVSYRVIPLWAIVLYSTLWQAFCTCYRNCPTVLSLLICSVLMKFDPFDDHSPSEVFQLSLFSFIPLHLLLCAGALTVDVCGKWLLLGRRKAGAYPWDQSSYCQRWQLYLTLQEIRRGERHKTGVLDMITGSQYLVWYFRALGAAIGNNVCLYPNGGDPMMTEPDLCSIGDFAAIDDASVVAHINTRGVFRLNELVVGRGCVLKSGSRLLSGANMDAHSILLEHTLVLAGENVESGSVWQGWPSQTQVSLTKHRQRLTMQLNSLARAKMLRLTSNVKISVGEQQSNSSKYGGTSINSGAVTTMEEGETGRGVALVGTQYGGSSGGGGSSSKSRNLKIPATIGERQPLLASPPAASSLK